MVIDTYSNIDHSRYSYVTLYVILTILLSSMSVIFVCLL